MAVRIGMSKRFVSTDFAARSTATGSMSAPPAMYTAAILMAAMTVKSIPAFGDTVSVRAWFLLVPLMLFGFGVNYWMFRVGQGGHRAVAPAARRDLRGDATLDHAWIFGVSYVNRHDPAAMWVENPFGLGYTPNFGNWRAWLLIIVFMLIPKCAGRLLF